MNYPLVSIIILCWNRLDDVRDVLLRLRETEYINIEIIVVDNASTDKTSEVLPTEFPEIILLTMQSNLGIAGYNHGFEIARGKYIVILDDDSFPESNAIKLMVERFEKLPQLGVVAFDVRNASARGTYKFNPANAEQACNYQMSFNGAGVGIRTDLFRNIGWYPDEFFLYWNEQDTAFRVLNFGYLIQTFPDIISWHKSSPRNRINDRAAFYYTRNAFWLIWKNYPVWLGLRWSIRLLYMCVYHSVEQGTLVYIKAMLNAFLNIGKLQGKRRPVSSEIIRRSRVAFEISFSQYR